MSYVATVVIFGPYIPQDVEKALAEGYTQSDGRLNNFAELSAYGSDEPGGFNPWDLWAGQLGPEASVWGGAFNYLNPTELHAWLSSLPWTDKVGVMWEANGDTGLVIWTFGPEDEQQIPWNAVKTDTSALAPRYFHPSEQARAARQIVTP